MGVPQISDERLEDLMQRIKPVVRFSRKITQTRDELMQDSDGDLYYIQDVHPRNTAYTWDPKPARLAKDVNPNPYKTIETVHSYGAPVFFKPSIAEVLAQIPESDLESVVAFEIVGDVGFTDGGSYHLTNTALYEKSGRRRRK